jgi:hypothetical protein
MPGKNRAPTLRQLAQRRLHQPCRVPGCKKRRDPSRAASYCIGHAARHRHYGSPFGRRIWRKDYAAERKAVDALFRKYPEHPGVLEACAFLRDWLDAAAAGEKVPGAIHVARLQRYGVEPLTILAEVCAVFAWEQRNPRALPDDGVPLTCAMAIAMLYLVPREQTKAYVYPSGRTLRYKEAGSITRREVGTHLRDNLVRLLVNVWQAIEHEQQQQKNAVLAMSAPFNQPT